jgi:hypothetical protein
MSSRRRPSRPVVLVAVLGVLVVVLLVLVAGRSGDDAPELRIVHGAPSAGFPLRGDLARDEGALRAAAAEWLEEDREEDDDDVFSDHTDEFEITALWAGRVGDDLAVILAHERTAALVTSDHEHGGEPLWSLNRTLPIADAEAPTIVPFEGAILVADDAKAVFRTADRSGASAQDGLWRANGRSGLSSPGEGVLVLPDGLTHRRFTSGKQPPAIVVTGEDSVVRTVGTRLADRLVRAPLSFDGPALQRFVAAARGDSGDDEGRRAPSLDGPAKVEIVQEGPLEGIGPTTVVSVGADEATGGVRPRVVAAVGGSDVAGAEGAERIALQVDDEQNAGDGLRASRGPAMGAAYVRRMPDAPDGDTAGSADPADGIGSSGDAGTGGTDGSDDAGDAPVEPGPTLLLLAGDRAVRSFELLVGTRRITRPGPVAVVRAPWQSPDGSRRFGRTTDVVLFGRTAGGAVVRPGVVSGTVDEVGED